jgi:hypothetical protein
MERAKAATLPRIIIHRVGKRMKLSRQGEKDQYLMTARRRMNQANLPFVLSEFRRLMGEAPKKKNLIPIAHRVSLMCEIPLDRLAKRSRDCLLCWFCENWSIIAPRITDLFTQGNQLSGLAEKSDAFSEFGLEDFFDSDPYDPPD